MGQIVGGVFLALFVAVGLGLLGYGAHAWRLASVAAHWPTATGRIVSRDFDIDRDSESTTYRTKVRYVYEVNGRELTGETIAFGYAGSSSERFHREVYAALSVGRDVAVRYDPNDPSRAALSHGVNQSILFIVIFGATWTLFTLGMATMVFVGDKGAARLLGNIQFY
ncbi:MAG: DUF3592 domain-containing protein [Parvularculaceae bacterium]